VLASLRPLRCHPHDVREDLGSHGVVKKATKPIRTFRGLLLALSGSTT